MRRKGPSAFGCFAEKGFLVMAVTTMKGVWAGGMKFVHQSASGHEVVTDAAGPTGNDTTAASPMELLILGLIGCTGLDVASILERMRQPLEGLEVSAECERADSHPKIYTKIHLTYIFKGDLDEAKVKRAIELSETTYCSVSAMLGKAAVITSHYVIEG
jgi:putative redox protein